MAGLPTTTVFRALSLDNGDFLVGGELTQLEIRDAPPCG